jgi:hypothetical protein
VHGQTWSSSLPRAAGYVRAPLTLCPTVPACVLWHVRAAQEVTIKLSDQGGGIARSVMPRLWSYTHTTASPLSPQLRYSSRPLPMAGFALGLPMSRLVLPPHANARASVRLITPPASAV